MPDGGGTTDTLGWRRKLAIVVPSTNTVVQPEMEAMRPAGVTNHIARISVPNVPLGSDEAFSAFMGFIDVALEDAVRSALSCEPHAIVMGMSSETFWGGAEGSRQLKEKVEAWAGRPVVMGSEAADAALRRYGARRIGVITPYMPVGDEQVVRYFHDMGYTVTAIRGLRCSGPVAIAQVTPESLWAALAELSFSLISRTARPTSSSSALRAILRSNAVHISAPRSAGDKRDHDQQRYHG